MMLLVNLAHDIFHCNQIDAVINLVELGSSILGLAYGALTASVYIWLKASGVSGGLGLFTSGCGCLFLMHLCATRPAQYRKIFEPKNILRGILFGLSQVCLLQSQVSHTTSVAFISAVAGSLTGSACGHFLLSERIRPMQLLGLTICIVALIIGQNGTAISFWAITGGVLQGLTATVARSIATRSENAYFPIASGCCFAALIGLLVLLFKGELNQLKDIAIGDVCISATAIMAVQYSFFYVLRKMDIQRASVFSLTRIPWAIVIERIFLGIPIILHSFEVGLLIILGSIISNFKPLVLENDRPKV